MQFILIAVGSIGDVFPLLEISRELVRRGHSVKLIANPWYEKHVGKTGAELIPVGTRDDQERMLALRDLWHPRKGWPLWLKLGALPLMRPTYEFIREHNLPGETVVGGSWGALGAIIAREKLGVPLVTLHLEPDKFRTAYQSAVMPAHMMLYQSTPPWLKRIQYRIADWLVIDRVFHPVNDFRRELGLPSTRGFLGDWIHSPDLTIGMFPEWWGPGSPSGRKQCSNPASRLPLTVRQVCPMMWRRFSPQATLPLCFLQAELIGKHTSSSKPPPKVVSVCRCGEYS